MRRILSERSLVVILFIIVIISFSIAQQQTLHLENMPAADMQTDADVKQPIQSLPGQQIFTKIPLARY